MCRIQQTSITTKQRVEVLETRRTSDGEEEIKGGTRDVVIAVRGCGLVVALRIEQEA